MDYPPCVKMDKRPPYASANTEGIRRTCKEVGGLIQHRYNLQSKELRLVYPNTTPPQNDSL